MAEIEESNAMARLEALERQVRRHQRIGGGVLLALLVLACVGQAGQAESKSVVRAEKVEVVDSEGRVRADISAPDGFGVLRLLRADGSPAAAFRETLPRGAAINLCMGKSLEDGVTLSCESGNVWMTMSASRASATVRCGSAGEALQLRDKDGKIQFEAPGK